MKTNCHSEARWIEKFKSMGLPVKAPFNDAEIISQAFFFLIWSRYTFSFVFQNMDIAVLVRLILQDLPLMLLLL